MVDDSLFLLEDKKTEESHLYSEKPWVVAIIDDDEQVHHITKMVLKSFQFDNKKLHFISAYSAQEGFELFKTNKQIAVCLLDVVMESDHAGLNLVKQIREEMKNRFTRIVLRTGQPGQAPEEKVIANYDINDYKEKNELTIDKLHTVMYSCLRAYRDIISLDHTRKGLEQVIDASANVFNNRFIEQFSQGILSQVTSILNYEEEALYGISEGLTAHKNEDEDDIKVISGIGKYSKQIGKDIRDVVPKDILKSLCNKKTSFASNHVNNSYIACYHGENQSRNILFIEGVNEEDSLQIKLLDIFSRNVLVAFENMYLKVNSDEAQKEIVYLLGGAVETRSSETGEHLKRVAIISKQLAIYSGMTSKQADLIHQASPLHDLGKIGISDSILNKPGKLDADEMRMMKTHSQVGYNMLKDSSKNIFKIAALIALEHHERWDGKGYPDGKKEQEVSIEGRIVAIADVFDALCSKRCYKASWKLDDVFTYMQENSGTQFDPQLTELLIKNKYFLIDMYK